MHQRKISLWVSLLVLLGLLAGCAAPVDTAAVATEPAAEEAAPVGPFEPMSMAAENCDYGGLFNAIEAVDELTVKFTLCQPDPAFLPKSPFLPSPSTTLTI